MFIHELQKNLSNYSFITPHLEKLLAKLEIKNLFQLLTFFPHSYQNRTKSLPLNQALFFDFIYVSVSIKKVEPIFSRHFRSKFVKVYIQDLQSSTQATLLFFGRSYIQKTLFPGQILSLYAHFKKEKGHLVSSQFDYEIKKTQSLEFDRIIPIYSLTKGLTGKRLRSIIYKILSLYAPQLENEIPPFLVEKYQLLNKSSAIQAMHFPCDFDKQQQAQKTLIFEENLHHSWILSSMSSKFSKIKRATLSFSFHFEKKIKLPFSLTQSQKNVIAEINKELQKSHPMIRLLQGDVGSGKTLVSLFTSLNILEQGFQVAFMAPTEVLAFQHFQTIAHFLRNSPFTCRLLVGSLKQKEKNQILADLKNGKISFLVGTHSLFSSSVEFSNLRYIIIDEQHKFGVIQRQLLSQKEQKADILMMSATPIPRTLALARWGNTPISTISELPQNRKPIKTYLALQSSQEKVFQFLEKQLQAHHQIYFVSPLIQESEKIDLRSASESLKILQNRFPHYKIADLHSQKTNEEKEQILLQFKNNKIAILVATSIIEVGIDIPNATCMVVDHAERFGLATLHQLRGRIGRSDLASYFFLLYNNILSSIAKERLKILKETQDGFLIAEKDMELRGQGNTEGHEQSGHLPFVLTDLKRDEFIIQETAEIVQKAMQNPQNNTYQFMQNLFLKKEQYNFQKVFF